MTLSRVGAEVHGNHPQAAFMLPAPRSEIPEGIVAGGGDFEQTPFARMKCRIAGDCQDAPVERGEPIVYRLARQCAELYGQTSPAPLELTEMKKAESRHGAHGHHRRTGCK